MMSKNLKIELKLTSTFFDDGIIPKPVLPFELNGGKFIFVFKDKDQLTEYTSRLYVQYEKFENPQTGLIADLLAEIAHQLPQS